ncbi:hypothetical protein WDU94_008041 [Cyamophila willieti]
MAERSNEKVDHADKSKEQHKKRKDKSVNLSDYNKKSDGTLVPKPKIIAKLRGVQPRQGGFMAKKLAKVQSECSSPTCRDISELKKLLADKNHKQKPPSSQSRTISINSYCNLADLDLNPADEENIVDHFERLLLFMHQLAENARKIKKKQAHGIIDFLESIKTPNCQLAPNAQALVEYIEHLLKEKRKEERNNTSDANSEDSDTDSDDDQIDTDEDNIRRRPMSRTPVCPPKRQKSCPKEDKGSCPKDKKEEESKKEDESKIDEEK